MPSHFAPSHEAIAVLVIALQQGWLNGRTEDCGLAIQSRREQHRTLATSSNSPPPAAVVQNFLLQPSTISQHLSPQTTTFVDPLPPCQSPQARSIQVLVNHGAFDCLRASHIGHLGAVFKTDVTILEFCTLDRILSLRQRVEEQTLAGSLIGLGVALRLELFTIGRKRRPIAGSQTRWLERSRAGPS